MLQIIRVVESEGTLFKEGEIVKVTLSDNRQITGRLRLPHTGSVIVGMFSLYLAEIKQIKHVNLKGD